MAEVAKAAVVEAQAALAEVEAAEVAGPARWWVVEEQAVLGVQVVSAALAKTAERVVPAAMAVEAAAQLNCSPWAGLPLMAR